ncbi:flavodoxin family protein [Senegalia massiliensis]|uniref:Flavodoxin family protein n=1 Tax=Senegalia massiliensis TaxID=1720316 RepID=A0A845R3E4_9CLOT|nr:flavodoxin family protein [Senegalia massiliensis]NBI08206.1 flavodoxin family protein [Senegalia massiliensis]
MKVLGIIGSPRKNGNTDILVDSVLQGVKEKGFEVEKIYLSDLDFKGCIACEGCRKTCKCVLKDDLEDVYVKSEESDGIVLGSPTYFYNVTWLTKKFLDRLYAYEVFDETDRSVWLSPNEVNGSKYAVTVSICEQETIENMGFTSDAMNLTLQSVGWRTVESIKALYLYERGEAEAEYELKERSKKAGVKLTKTIILADKTRSI